MSRQLDSTLLAMGHIRPRAVAREIVFGSAADEARVWDLVLWHRVVGLAESRFRAAGGDQAPGDFGVAVRQREHLRELLREEWERLEKVTDRLGIAVAGVKGYATRALYEQDRYRDLSDIDLLVADVDDAWSLAEELKNAGYDWYAGELPWLKRDLESGLLYGQLPLRRYVGDAPLRADIHFGGYSVRHCRFIPCAPGRPGLHVWGALENLPLLVGNAAGDFVIRLKDINDIVMMLESDIQPDWSASLRALRDHGLGGFWNAMLVEVERHSSLSPTAQARIPDLRIAGVRPERVPLGRPVWRRRWRATVADAYRAGRETGLSDAWASAWSAYRYYRRPLSLSVASRCRHRSGRSVLQDLRNDACVRLVPGGLLAEWSDRAVPVQGPHLRAAIAGSRTMTEIAQYGHSVLEVDGELFLPTIFYDLCPVQLGIFQRLQHP